MKKTISLILCVIMCLSVMSAAVIPAAAADNLAKTFYSVTQSEITDDCVTYTVKLNSGIQKFCGTVFNVKYDPAVLSVKTAGPCTTQNASGVKTDNIAGEYQFGAVYNDETRYSVAYINSTNINISSVKNFFSITFEIISDERPVTKVEFFCREFITEDTAENDIGPADEPQIFASFELTTLCAPVLESASMAADGICFKWQSVVGAEGYTVLRKSTSEGVWEEVAEVSADTTEYTDKEIESGERYTYSVLASNSFGESTYNSTGVSSMFIAKPAYTVSNTKGGIEIKWNEVEGAVNYKVMKKTSDSDEWTQITKTAASVTDYRDTDVKSGEKYYYDVNAVNGTDSTFASEEGIGVVYIAAPAITAVKNEQSGILLTWSNVEGADSYVIYKKASGDEEFKPVVTVGADSEKEYLDAKVTTGETYTYAIKAVSAEGESALNEYSGEFMRVPTTDVLKAELEKDGIFVEWKGIESADKYTLYRKTVTSAVWQKVADIDYTENTYTDKTVAGGSEYEYAVTTSIGDCESARGGVSDSVYYIPAPVISAVNKANGINLSWAACGGAKSYDVYRQEAGGELEKVANVTTTAYIDTKVTFGSEYSYAVVAKGAEIDSLMSDQTAFVTRMAAPDGVKAVNAVNGVFVEWDEMDSADSYNVYRKAGSGDFEYIGSSTSADFTDEKAVSGNRYSYAVEACMDSSVSARSAASAAILYIAAPQITSLSASANGVDVKWAAVTGASKYRVMRKNASGAWVKLADTSSVTYTDKSAVAGNTYYYTVVCLSSDGKTYVSEYDKDGKSINFCAAPVITGVSNTEDGISVVWAASNGADKYRVYKKTGTGSWTNAGTTSSNTFNDKNVENGKTYYYTVRCLTADGNFASAYDTTGKKIVCVSTPGITAAANTKDGIKVTWGKISGASKYKVYRKTDGSSWVSLGETTSNTYTDKTPVSGKIYTYTVRAYNGSYYSSFDSEGYTITRLSQPELVAISNAVSGVAIKWNEVDGALLYRVYRKTSSGSWASIGTTTSSVYGDKTAVSGVTYVYTVRAISADNSISTYDTNGITIKFLSRPTIAKFTPSAKSIKLDWAKINGASKYYVYRMAGNETGWTRIATVTGLTYTDTNVKAGTKYTYTLRAVSGSYVSKFSQTGWPFVFLGVPSLTSATSTKNGVVVKWGKSTNAAGYYVYRKTANSGWARVATVSGGNTLTYTDKTAQKGVKYAYTVKAFNGNSYSDFVASGVVCTAKY